MLAYYSPYENLYLLNVERYPKQIESKKFINEPLKTKYIFNYYKDASYFSEISLNNKISSLLELDTTWKNYDMEFEVVNHFYFKFELYVDKLINNLLYFYLDSRTSDYHFFEIVRIENAYLFKIFKISKSNDLKIPIFKKILDYEKNTKVTIIFSKTNDTMTIVFKNKSHKLTELFTFRNLNFVRFYFLLNQSNMNALTSIYYSNTKDFREKVKMMKNCSIESFKAFQCTLSKPSQCRRYFCEGCCKNRLIKNNADCIEVCKEKLNNLIN